MRTNDWNIDQFVTYHCTIESSGFSMMTKTNNPKLGTQTRRKISGHLEIMTIRVIICWLLMATITIIILTDIIRIDLIHTIRTTHTIQTVPIGNDVESFWENTIERIQTFGNAILKSSVCKNTRTNKHLFNLINDHTEAFCGFS